MTGFLLVGGQGRRIGGNKPLRLFEGRPLASIAWDLLAPCSRRIALGRGELPPHIGPQWWEEPAGQGPLVALAWALERSDSQWNAVLAVDYPQLPVDLWEQLQQQRACQALAALPRVNGRMHPLCGLYHRDLAGALRAAVARGAVAPSLPPEVAADGVDRALAHWSDADADVHWYPAPAQLVAADTGHSWWVRFSDGEAIMQAAPDAASVTVTAAADQLLRWLEGHPSGTIQVDGDHAALAAFRASLGHLVEPAPRRSWWRRR